MFREILKLYSLLKTVAAQKNKALEIKKTPLKNSESKFISKKYTTEFIQILRKYQFRRKYRFKHIRDNELHDYRAFFVGNAPEISGLDPFKQKNKQIGLIVLSGMRGLLLACQLGCKDKIPKIFLIENSQQVCSLWYKLRDFALINKTKKVFLENFPQFLKDNQNLFRRNGDAASFFHHLFQDFGFEYVRSIICKTTIIKQTWADTQTFLKLRNYISYLKIEVVYAFPSNILSLRINKDKQDIILKNIIIPKPFLSIHTNLNPQTKMPDKVFLIDEKRANQTKEVIFKKK